MSDTHTQHDEDLWEVQSQSGVHTVTLDQLDAAFEAEMVTAETLVRPRGATSWQRLAVVAGLEPAPQEPGTTSLAPMVVANDASSAMLPSAPPPAGPLPDLDLDLLDEGALKPKRGKAIAAAVGAVAVLGLLIGLGATKLSGMEKTAGAGLTTQALGAAPVAVEDLPPKQPEGTRLTDEQKQQLLEADKAREASRKAKAPAAPQGKAPARRKSTGGSPFVQGGDKYDPLNGAL